jgi:hypothetical protein
MYECIIKYYREKVILFLFDVVWWPRSPHPTHLKNPYPNSNLEIIFPLADSHSFGFEQLHDCMIQWNSARFR